MRILRIGWDRRSGGYWVPKLPWLGARLAAGRTTMLILTRRVGETVMIGDEVTITVLGVKGGQIRVGINAPKSVLVHREEIYERIKHEEQSQTADRSAKVA